MSFFGGFLVEDVVYNLRSLFLLDWLLIKGILGCYVLQSSLRLLLNLVILWLLVLYLLEVGLLILVLHLGYSLISILSFVSLLTRQLVAMDLHTLWNYYLYLIKSSLRLLLRFGVLLFLRGLLRPVR